MKDASHEKEDQQQLKDADVTSKKTKKPTAKIQAKELLETDRRPTEIPVANVL